MQERASCGWATTAFLAGREIKIVTETKAMREVDFLTRRKLNNDFDIVPKLKIVGLVT